MGAADIYKCFDQIPRALIYELMRRAGGLECVVTGYSNFLDDMIVRNMLAGGYGEGYTKECSMHQGCPMGMMVVALLIRPWLLKNEADGPVVEWMRDSGTHFTTRRTMHAPTLTKRLKKATTVAKRVKKSPIGFPGKAKVLRGKVVPIGLYWCETSRVNDVAMSDFRKAVAAAIVQDPEHGSEDLAYTVGLHGVDLDANTDVIVRRVLVVRRVIAIRPEVTPLGRDILNTKRRASRA